MLLCCPLGSFPSKHSFNQFASPAMNDWLPSHPHMVPIYNPKRSAGPTRRLTIRADTYLHRLLKLRTQEQSIRGIPLRRGILDGEVRAAVPLSIEGETLRSQIFVSNALAHLRGKGEGRVREVGQRGGTQGAQGVACEPPARACTASRLLSRALHHCFTMPMSSLVWRSCVVRCVPNASNIFACRETVQTALQHSSGRQASLNPSQKRRAAQRQQCMLLMRDTPHNPISLSPSLPFSAKHCIPPARRH